MTGEQAERDAQEEQEQIKKARYERALAEFDNWLSSMSDEERQELNTGRRGPERQWLWSQFKKKQGYEGKIWRFFRRYCIAIRDTINT